MVKYVNNYFLYSMKENILFIVFALEHYNPLGVIRNLGESGVNPIFIAIKHHGKIASLSKYLKKVHYADTIEEGYDILIKEYGDCYKSGDKPFLLFSDDRSVGFFDTKYEEVKDKFYFFNAGKTGRITHFIDKFNILEIAQRHGLKTLKSCVTKNGVIPDDIEYPVITKSISPNEGGWKSDVHICYSEAELKEAFNNILSDEVLIQKYIEKKNEMTYEGFSINHGDEVLVGIQCEYNYLIKGYYSPYHSVKSPEDASIVSSVKSLFKEIGFEGMFEVEFLIDQDDTCYFSEINFRNSPWSYSATKSGMFLPYAWCMSMRKGTIDDSILKHIDEPYNAMVEPIDFGKRVEEGLISMAEWLKDFKEAKCTYYYNSEDLAPYEALYSNWDNVK